MVTNEDILMSYPDQLIQVSEASARLDSFDGVFDGTDLWLLRLPYNPASAGVTAGLIVQVTEANSANPRSGLYIVSVVNTDSLRLRQAGYDAGVGRGPGVTFGTATVKCVVYDLSSFIRSAQKAVDSVACPKYTAMDARLATQADDAIKRLALVRLCTNTEQLRMLVGAASLSTPAMEEEILGGVKSALLQFMSRNLGSAVKWTKLVR